MDDYYNNYYLINCDLNFTVFSTWQFLATAVHILSVFLVCVNLFGAYCILFKTPPKMERVKWVMFNVHFWSTSVDIMLNSIITPYFFFPGICGFPVGVFAHFGVNTGLQIFLGQSFVGILAVAILMMFENRHRTLVTGKWSLENRTIRIVYYAINYTYGVMFVFPVFMDIPEQEPALLYVLNNIVNCPTPEFFLGTVYVLTTDNTQLMAMIIIFLFAIVFQCAFFIIHSLYFLLTRANSMSKRTLQLQKRFIMSVCIQVANPVFVLVVPVVMFMYVISAGYYNQALNNITVILISLHGITATISLVLLNEPYRAFLLSILNKNRHKLSSKLAKSSQVFQLRSSMSFNERSVLY
ncbi:unnamed protein product [Caenorhabditis bovis]|uniref:Serpentine Receptor, class H n=1 Tax=Caenorhabditis bovis TaxID=2654633 RepID=A0A8S1E4J4_9PELO|nr:unnamed protein product [Caenorhabditis bovis]